MKLEFMGWAGGSRRAVGAVLGLCVALVAGCGENGSDDGRRQPEAVTIAILRAVAAPDPGPEKVLLAELAAAGYAEDGRLTVMARDPAEVYADPAEAEKAVARWAADGADVIVALSTSGARAAAKGAPRLPVLFLANDPVAAGLVDDERSSEGRLTGATFRVPADRTIEAARRVIPGLRRLGLLHPSDDPAALTVREQMSGAAASLGIQLQAAAFADDGDVAAAVQSLHAAGAGAVVLANAPSTVRAFLAIRAATEQARLPVIANTTADFALAVLAPDTAELYRQMARQLVRLIEGDEPSQIPVEDPGKFVFTVDLRVAQRLGVAVDEQMLEGVDIIR